MIHMGSHNPYGLACICLFFTHTVLPPPPRIVLGGLTVILHTMSAIDVMPFFVIRSFSRTSTRFLTSLSALADKLQVLEKFLSVTFGCPSQQSPTNAASIVSSAGKQDRMRPAISSSSVTCTALFISFRPSYPV